MTKVYLKTSVINSRVLPGIRGAIDDLNKAIDCLNRTLTPVDLSSNKSAKLNQIIIIRNNLVSIEEKIINGVKNFDELESYALFIAGALPKNQIPLRKDKFSSL